MTLNEALEFYHTCDERTREAIDWFIMKARERSYYEGYRDCKSGWPEPTQSLQ
jgi:hypothetical protein